MDGSSLSGQYYLTTTMDSKAGQDRATQADRSGRSRKSPYITFIKLCGVVRFLKGQIRPDPTWVSLQIRTGAHGVWDRRIQTSAGEDTTAPH